MPSRRVLVVDDDPSLARTMAWVLRQHGYDVATARNPDEMVDSLATRECEIVLLDLGLPDGGGAESLRRLADVPEQCRRPVVALSDSEGEDETVRALSLGASDVVRKPLRVRELLARIEAQLRTVGGARAAERALEATTSELSRAVSDAAARRRLVDIVYEITSDLSPEEILRVSTRRLARALDLSHCSAVLARPGDRTGVVAASADRPGVRNREISLDRYPEVRAALDRGRSVLVEDVHTSALLDAVRPQWAAEGRVPGPRSSLAVPFVLERVQAGVLHLRRSGAGAPPLGADDVAFAEAVARVAATSVERALLLERTQQENARLAALARTDPLTQTLNRRALTVRLAEELERARRYGSTVTLLVIDLDHFKRVNDSHGHLAGDEVLREMATLLHEAARSVDVVARYGGEEFVVVLPETSLEGGLAFAERLRERVAGQAFFTGGRSRVRLTASVGVATFPGPDVDSVETLFARADAALYRAKEEGRNRVRS